MSENEIRPFTVAVPQSDLDHLMRRLRDTRFAQEITGAGDDYGVSGERVRRLVRHALEGFDWRALEARLNAHPQFTTEIDGQNIHFLHVRSPEPDAIPLLMTHGWPGSVLEFLEIADALADPGAHGSDGPAFHLVIPSLPGIGFSGPTTERGWGTRRTARAWAELMRRLGYERYGMHGNDGGSMVSPEVARIDTEHVIGFHVNQLFSFPSGAPGEMDDLTEEEGKAMARLQWFWEEKGAFNILHSQQPATIAHALADSPAGLMGWMDQLMGPEVTDDFAVGNMFVYWLTETGPSSIRFYREDKLDPAGTEPTTVPVGVAVHAGDFQSIRRFAERDHHDIVQWRTHERGGHYADHEEPRTALADIRDFFAAVG